MAAAFDHQVDLFAGGRSQPVDDAARNHQVIALTVRKIAELRFQRAAAAGDVHDFVRARIAVEERICRRRTRQRQGHVLVEQQQFAVAHGAAAGRFETVGAQMAHPQGPFGFRLTGRGPGDGHGLDRGRPPHRVQQRLQAGEAQISHQLLVIERTVRLAERDVPLGRQTAQLVVDGHDRSFRSRRGRRRPAPFARDRGARDCRAAPVPARSSRTGP